MIFTFNLPVISEYFGPFPNALMACTEIVMSFDSLHIEFIVEVTKQKLSSHPASDEGIT